MSSLLPEQVRIAASVDHTMLKPGMLVAQVDTLCGDAIQYGFAAVCVPPMFVKQAKALCQNSSVQVATVIGFPFGYSAVEAKLAEILLAIVDGADELDLVINFTAVKNKDWNLVANEINHLLPVVHAQGRKLKTIIESGVLTDEEIIKCCELYGAAGVDFVKTSTGYADKGATVEAVALMRKNLPSQVAIKASGGIRDASFAIDLLNAGATRLGTSSGVALVKGLAANAGQY